MAPTGQQEEDVGKGSRGLCRSSRSDGSAYRRAPAGHWFACPLALGRSWPVAGFEAIRIYYLLDEDAIRVIRILHGKRDVKRILEREAGA